MATRVFFQGSATSGTSGLLREGFPRRGSTRREIHWLGDDDDVVLDSWGLRWLDESQGKIMKKSHEKSHENCKQL